MEQGALKGSSLREFLDAFSAEVERRVDEAGVSARRGASERFNRFAQRLRRAESREQWVEALKESVTDLCGPAALVEAGGEPPAGSSNSLSIPVAARGETLATIRAERTPQLDVNALELLAALAASVTFPSVGASGPPPGAPLAGTGQTWQGLPREERDLHLRAQRFARVRVAEMRLYHATAVANARRERNIYASLRAQIDESRGIFAREYMALCPSMVDYLHLEFIQTLAEDDETLLGPEYPGPLLS